MIVRDINKEKGGRVNDFKYDIAGSHIYDRTVYMVKINVHFRMEE